MRGYGRLNCHYQSLEGLEELVFRRWIGWSLRLISLSMAVLGCQSENALRRFAKSFAKKCATRSFAIKSRNAQGIFFDNKKNEIARYATQRSNKTHFVIVPVYLGVERLENKFRVFIPPFICHEKIVHGQPAPDFQSGPILPRLIDTHEYVASSS